MSFAWFHKEDSKHGMRMTLGDGPKRGWQPANVLREEENQSRWVPASRIESEVAYNAGRGQWYSRAYC
jgi:hypothetical protein